MATVVKVSKPAGLRKRSPAITPEDRENQMIAMAVDITEQKMRDGTAPAMLIAHYLKLATTREQLEKEKLKKEIALLEAKRTAVESATKIEELYSNAIKAMTSYGSSINHEDSDSFDG